MSVGDHWSRVSCTSRHSRSDVEPPLSTKKIIGGGIICYQLVVGCIYPVEFFLKPNARLFLLFLLLNALAGGSADVKCEEYPKFCGVCIER